MAPGPLIGRGRAADVYDLGSGRVLRRYRTAPDQTDLVTREALVMGHLAAHGYPVPEVFDAKGTDLVMERLSGVTMLTDLERRPWRLDRHARLWADLHLRLATVPVDGLVERGVPVRFGAPIALLHLDFHPDNIMLTPTGPMVFDWSNAALGPAAADVAESWIVGATSTVDGGWFIRVLTKLMRRRLIDRFVDRCGRPEAEVLLPTLAEHRLRDPNVRPEEAARIRDLIRAHSVSAPATNRAQMGN